MASEALVREGYSWAIDILPIKKPAVNFGFAFAYCEVACSQVEIKVSEKGHLLHCIFNGQFYGCKKCPWKVREVTSFE